MGLLRKGSKGPAVRKLQEDLVKLGFELDVDGDFGPATLSKVEELQTLFGYTVDGLVGKGTQGLIEAQIGYGWDRKSPEAEARALKSQGKEPAAKVTDAADKAAKMAAQGAAPGPDDAAKAVQAQKAAAGLGAKKPAK